MATMTVMTLATTNYKQTVMDIGMMAAATSHNNNLKRNAGHNSDDTDNTAH